VTPAAPHTSPSIAATRGPQTAPARASRHQHQSQDGASSSQRVSGSRASLRMRSRMFLALGTATGGAVGASLARARAVEAALVARDGADADRIVAIGLAGSRRLVDDTNGPGNHRNRRVEVHTLDF